MTRASRTALMLIAVGCAACGITMHIEFHREPVPMGLRQRMAEGYANGLVDRIPPSDGFTLYTNGPSTDDVDTVDIQEDSRLKDRNLHVRAVFLDANGRALYEGEGDATIADGATLYLILSPTGPK